MSKIGVVTDSNSGILPDEAKELGIYVLAMPFLCDGETYYENRDLTREVFFEQMRNGKIYQTAQPSPAEVMALWDQALQEYDEILYIPMSSGLSGSCNTAKMLAMEEPYEDKVYVVDNGRVATPLHRSVLDALALIEQGYSAEEIRCKIEETKDGMVIYVGLETLENLKRGGRISGGAAMLGTVLNLKPIMKFSTGLLDTFKKCRGSKKARKEMILAMKEEMGTTFKKEYENGEIHLVAASSADEETTRGWIREIEEAFPGMHVMCDYLPLGLCVHIGEGGLGIGCSCNITN